MLYLYAKLEVNFEINSLKRKNKPKGIPENKKKSQNWPIRCAR